MQAAVTSTSGLAPERRSLPSTLLLSRAEGLQLFRRGERVLLIEPESASWFVCEPHHWEIFRAITRPITLEALASGLPAAPRERIEALVGQLYQLGLLRFNGRPYHDAVGLFDHSKGVGPQFLALHMAHGCNFRCSYCYNSSEMFKGRVMTREVSRRILEKAFQEIDAPALLFDFMGGEPLLAFEEILEVIRYGRELADRHGKAASFAMQTNAALLTEARALELKRLGVGVGVSIDGPAEIHDLYRISGSGQGTHDQVLPNLLRARDLGLQVSPLAVIYDPENYVPVLDYFVGLGFTGMRFNYSNYMGRAKENLSFVPERALSFHTHFMQMVERAAGHARRLGRRVVINDLNFMIRNVTTKKRDYMCMRSPCGLGEAILSFSVDGHVYACEEYEENTKGKFLLGRLEELDLGNLMALSEKLRQLKTRRVENIPKCSGCGLRNICGGGCTHKALAYHGELLREDPMCRFYELTYRELMWKIWDDPELPALLGGLPDART